MTKPIGVMAAVLMSAGLFDFARGSSLADQDKGLSDFDVEAVRGQFQQIRAQTLKHHYLPSGSADTTTTTEQPGGDETRPGVAGITLTLLSKTVQASAPIKNRNLQESCADGSTSISVSSTVFPLMEGCLLPVVVDGSVGYTTGVATIFPFSSSSTDPPIWVAGYTDPATGDATIVCLSSESADDVDPSEATWSCDTSGSGDDFILADGELSVSCGCSTSTSPSPTITPAPTSNPVPACADGDSFSIVSDGIPDGDGCYVNTELVVNDNLVYSTSGRTDLGEIFVFASEEDTSSTARIVWFLSLLVDDDSSQDSDTYCASVVEAAFYHPSEVPEWTCDAGVSIDVTCGCSSSPSPGSTLPTPTPVSPRTPTPVAPPTPTPLSPRTPTPVAPPTPTPVSPRTPTPVAPPTTRSVPSPTASPVDADHNILSHPNRTSHCTFAVPPGIPPTNHAAGEEAGAIVNACPGDGSFTITASANPVLSGCFIGSTTIDGLLVYTVSGTTSQSEITIFAVETNDGDLNWSIAYIDLSDSDESQLYCTSVEPAVEVNPGDASWICDFTGDYVNVLLATEEDISIVCGSCGTSVGTPQPTASRVPPPTPTPVSERTPTPVSTPVTPTAAEPTWTPAPSPASLGGSPLVSDTCSGDGSFTITANAAPNLDGCYKDTFESLPEGWVLYSRSGEATESEVMVFSIETDDGDFNWVIGFLDIGGQKESRGFCLSVESASDVNPGNASWICDFTGNSENFQLSSEVEMSIICGSCTEVAPDGATQDASPASKLGVGVIAAGGAGMVSVASVLAGWF